MNSGQYVSLVYCIVAGVRFGPGKYCSFFQPERQRNSLATDLVMKQLMFGGLSLVK